MSFDWKKQKLVSPGLRYQGQFIDGLVSLLLFAISAYVVKAFLPDGIIANISIMFLPVTYYLVSDAFPNGQSLGKKIIGIAVVNKSTGKHCTLIQSIVRNILTPFLGVFDVILIILKRRQRLGDILANTIVISRRKLF